MELETTIETLAPALLRYCRGLTGDAALAEEASQDALTALVDRWRRLGPPENSEAFAFSIARRRAKRSLWRARLMHPLEALAESRDAAPDLEIEVGRRDELVRTLMAIRRLPARNREALLLVVVGELDVAAAAEVLGISHSAVKMRVLRARRQLSERLARPLELAEGGGA